MKVFGIAGFKNSGKTTLMVELLRNFRKRGLKLATLKHAHHNFDIDHPGKDSYRHREAGAAEVIVISDRRVAHVRELEGEPEPTMAEMLEAFGPVDLVLVEGYKRESHPKLEVRRGDTSDPSLADTDPSVCAIVSNVPIPDAHLPVLPIDDIDGIAEFILRQLESIDEPG